jgi:hypothetical protein
MSSFYASHHIPATSFTKPQFPFMQDGQVGQVVENSNRPLVAPSIVDYEGIPKPAPDFRDGQSRTGHQDKDKKPKRGGPKKPGGFGHFLHKVFGAFN